MSGGNITSNTRLTRRFVGHAHAGMALIKIGHESTPYHVHKSLLAQHSEYFQRALNGKWKEGEEGIVILEDVDCNIFEIFVEWLYTQRVPTKCSEWLEDIPTQLDEAYKALPMAMVKAIQFGDRFLAPEFGRLVERTLICYLIGEMNVLYYEVITYAYENLRSKSLVLEAMIDAHCATFTTDMDNEENEEIYHREKLPWKFLLGVMLRYAEIRKDANKDTLNICDYHGHSSQEEREDCFQSEETLEDDFKEEEVTEAE